jgi:hypothetical protein
MLSTVYLIKMQPPKQVLLPKRRLFLIDVIIANMAVSAAGPLRQPQALAQLLQQVRQVLVRAKVLPPHLQAQAVVG